jgi:hypothetical protein
MSSPNRTGTPPGPHEEGRRGHPRFARYRGEGAPEQGTLAVSGRSVLAVLGLWIGSAAILATAGYLTAASLTNDAETPTLTAGAAACSPANSLPCLA